MRAPLAWRDRWLTWRTERARSSRKALAARLEAQERRLDAVFAIMRETTEVLGIDPPDSLPAAGGAERSYHEGLRDGANIAMEAARKRVPPRSPDRQRRIEASGLRLVKP